MTASEAGAGERPEAPPMRSAWHVRLAAALLVLVSVAMAWRERAASGPRMLEEADAASSRGSEADAVAALRAAAEARCPFCRAPDVAFVRLAALAKDAESRGDLKAALRSWRATRAATLATRSLGRSSSRREAAEAEIVRLERREAELDPERPMPQAPRLQEALAANPEPSSIVFFFLALGGVLFAAGTRRFLRDGSRARTGALALALAGGALAAAGVLLF